MDKGRQKTIYVCQQCGRESSRWFGKCPGCDQWNTLIQSNATSGKQHPRGKSTSNNLPLELSAIADESSNRIILPFKELNRVLGGGLVPGSVVLIGGDPGIGKSTLLLQISGCLAGESRKILYVSGEESLQQLKLRANRVGIKGEGLFLLAETDLDSIISAIEDLSPVISIIDSIQTISQPGIAGVPGSLSQVRECTFRLAENAKKSGRPVIVAGHVTKDGAI
ncbi:MAG: AAA family ATPase, partial [Dehalococcoidia bacterium]|nr:AAA family ATPase [Dehalococcoidia bacterium]